MIEEKEHTSQVVCREVRGQVVWNDLQPVLLTYQVLSPSLSQMYLSFHQYRHIPFFRHILSHYLGVLQVHLGLLRNLCENIATVILGLIEVFNWEYTITKV